MKSKNLFAALIIGAVYAAGPALAQDSRSVSLVQRDFSDCSNSDVAVREPTVGGNITVDRGADGNTHVRVTLSARPNTTYHFFLKCVRLLGDITTQADGFAVANFDFPTNSAGNVFAFDMYPEGAPSGNKFQSVQVNFGRAAESPRLTQLPPDQQISRQVFLVPQDFSDCSNADVKTSDALVRGGNASVDRSADGTTHVRVRLAGQPNTSYHFFLKCVRLLGDLRTQADGIGIANFKFRSNEAGDVFAFDMYPDGAPLGNKYQSVQVDFRRPSPVPPVDPPVEPGPEDWRPVTGPSPRMEYVSQTAAGINITYADMPTGAEIVLVNGTSGEAGTSSTALRDAAGSLDVPIAGQGGGVYYLLARKQSDKSYIAQTVEFYIN